MPKFKSPDGRIFDDIESARAYFCKAYSLYDCYESCPLQVKRNPKRKICDVFAAQYPLETVHLMGYEIIEDELRPDCYQLANKSDSVSKNGKPKCEKCLWKDTVQCETCSNKNGFRRNYSNQEAKSDGGKPRPSLVPPALIRGVDAIREYGCKKYSDPENWRRVEPQRYWEATLRHALAAWNDWKAVDEESGMPAIWHMACNLAFLMQYMEEEKE